MFASTLTGVVPGMLFIGLWSVPALGVQDRSHLTLRAPATIAPGEFTHVSSVRELGDGSLLVADQGENRLVLIRWDNGQTVTVGRVGDGPGEYRHIGWLYPLAGDSTLLTDRQASRWLVLRGTEFVRTIAGHHPPNALMGSRLAGADLNSKVLGARGAMYSNRSVPRVPETADSLVLLRAVIGSETVDTVARLKGSGGAGYQVTQPAAGRPGRLVMRNPLAAADQALLLPDGWMVIVRVAPYGVEWLNAAGVSIVSRQLRFTPNRVTTAEKCAALTRWFGDKQPCDPSGFAGWPETMPPVLDVGSQPREPLLLSVPGGSVAIARAPSSGATEARYDIVNRRGELTGTIILPRRDLIIGFGARAVYVLQTDDRSGLQRIRRHPWP